jgi:choline monooxygenase
MREETERTLIRRVLQHAGAKTTDMVDQPAMSPVARYVDAHRLEVEHDRIFRRLPRVVGHTSSLVEAGDFLTSDAGAPLLIVRDKQGQLRGFYNVCRHRGTRLVSERCGSKKSFACPYHSWTYALDGSLQSITHREGFPGVLPSDRGLVEVSLQERFGLIWVQPEGEPRDVGDYLGADMCDDFDALKLVDHVSYRTSSIEKNINWKLALDIFLEGYHVHYAHRRTIAPMFFDNVNLFDRFTPHMRAVLPKRSINELRDTPERKWRLRPHANVLYMVFPNTLLLVQPDHVSAFHIYPRGIDGCRIDTYTLLPEQPTSDKAHDYWESNIEILRNAIAEDLALGESIQAGLSSGANESFVFGRFEQSLAWYHEDVERACDAYV